MLNQEFKLKRSTIFLSLAIFILLGSLAIIIWLPIIKWVRLILLVFTVLYGGYIIWRWIILHSSHSILSLQRKQDGQWVLQGLKTAFIAQLLGDSTLTRFVCILRFKRLNTRSIVSCVVFHDALSAHEYRRLLMLLKI